VTATECLELRPRLAEYAVSSLPEKERREVERHLEWCAGCRKEARELQDGAAIAGLSLAPTEPPKHLEERVVWRLRAASTRGRPRTYALRSVTVVAAVIGLLGIALAGVLVARQQSPAQNTRYEELSAQQTIAHLRHLYQDLRKTGQPSRISQAVLMPPAGHDGIGGALLVTPASSRFADQLVVLVGGLDRTGPYRVLLTGPGHKRFMVPGYMTPDVGGGGQLQWPGRTLNEYTGVEVRDSKGRAVLSGTFPRAP
jgi:putative zinc finger protein